MQGDMTTRGRLGIGEENRKRLGRVPKIHTPPYKNGVERTLELTTKRTGDDTNTEKKERALGTRLDDKLVNRLDRSS